MCWRKATANTQTIHSHQTIKRRLCGGNLVLYTIHSHQTIKRRLCGGNLVLYTIHSHQTIKRRLCGGNLVLYTIHSHQTIKRRLCGGNLVLYTIHSHQTIKRLCGGNLVLYTIHSHQTIKRHLYGGNLLLSTIQSPCMAILYFTQSTVTIKSKDFFVVAIYYFPQSSHHAWQSCTVHNPQSPYNQKISLWWQSTTFHNPVTMHGNLVLYTIHSHHTIKRFLCGGSLYCTQSIVTILSKDFFVVTRSSGLAKTILQGTVQGGRRRGRQRKRWEDNIKEWTGLEWKSILWKAENREVWRKLVVKSTVVPQWSARLQDR